MYKFRNKTDYERIFKNIIDDTCEYLRSNKLKSMVLGISGGIDSALIAAIAREVCAQMDNTVRLVGRSITISSNTRDEIVRSEMVGRAFCHDFEMLDYTDLWSKLVRTVQAGSNTIKIRISRGNIKARLRMIKLYDLAAINDGLVLATDNYTEYLLGFRTLHGDVGDFGMIQNLWKNEVYGLADFLATRFAKHSAYIEAEALTTCIDAVPTDGLGITVSDFDQLYPRYNGKLSPWAIYKEIDEVLYKHINNYYLTSADKIHEVIKRYKDTAFKRKNPYNISRDRVINNCIRE